MEQNNEVVNAVKSAVTNSIEPLSVELQAVKSELDVMKTNYNNLENRITESVAKSTLVVNDYNSNIDKLTPAVKALGVMKYLVEGKRTLNTNNDRNAVVKALENVKNDSGINAYAHLTAQKSLGLTSMTDGGYLVSDVMYEEILPYLFQKTIFDKIPTMKVPMSKGALTLPYDTIAGGDPTYVELQQAGGVIDLSSLGTYELKSKIIKGHLAVGNELIDSADYQVLPYLVQKLQTKLSLMLDAQFLKGTGGASSLLGLYTQALSGNKFNSAGTSLTNVIADMLKLINKIDSALAQNIELSQCRILMSSRSYYYILSLATTTGNNATIATELSSSNTIYGIPVIVSNTISNTISTDKSEIWLIDGSKIMQGIQQELKLEVTRNDVYTDANGTLKYGKETDETIIRIETRQDMMLSYRGAVAIMEQVAYSL